MQSGLKTWSPFDQVNFLSGLFCDVGQTPLSFQVLLILADDLLVPQTMRLQLCRVYRLVNNAICLLLLLIDEVVIHRLWFSICDRFRPLNHLADRSLASLNALLCLQFKLYFLPLFFHQVLVLLLLHFPFSRLQVFFHFLIFEFLHFQSFLFAFLLLAFESFDNIGTLLDFLPILRTTLVYRLENGLEDFFISHKFFFKLLLLLHQFLWVLDVLLNFAALICYFFHYLQLTVRPLNLLFNLLRLQLF